MVKQNYTLNNNQRRILLLLYKFRFITVGLLQEYLGLKYPSTVRNTLSTLCEQGLVACTFDKSYIKLAKSAYYYLDKAGLAIIKEDPDIDEGVLHNYYKNKSISEETRQHTLDMVAACNAIRSSHPDDYYIFTKYEIASQDEFPEQRPDLYLKQKKTSAQYLLVLAHDTPPFLTRKRLSQYIEHSEEEGWPDGDYPTLLFVLKTSSHESQLLDYAAKLLDSTGLEPTELPIAITTIKALTTKPYTSSIWTFVGSNEPKSLE